MSKQLRLLRLTLKYSASLYMFSFLQRRVIHAVLSLCANINHHKQRRNLYFLLLTSHTIYLYTSLEVLLFHPTILISMFPQVSKLIRRVGIEDFIKYDQRKPCHESHPHQTCYKNTTSLWWKWISTIPPVYMATKLFYHIILRQQSIDKFNFIFQCRQLLFIFCSSGLCGTTFCVYKQNFGVEKCGDRLGVVGCSLVGAGCSMLSLPLHACLNMVSSMYLGSLIAVGMSAVSGRR